MWSPLWSILVGKIPQFWQKTTDSDSSSYILESRWLLEICIMFCPLARAKWTTSKESKSVVACTCNSATLEAEFRNGVGSILAGGNSPSIGG